MSATPQAEPESPGAARVLVVDDDSGICQSLKWTLTQRGYDVTTCQHSHRVLDLLKGEPHDCVLLDIRMPGLQGTELLPIIKHNYPQMPVILISAYCHDADSSYFSSLGASEIVAKPFAVDQITEAIGRAVGATETIPLVLTSLSLTEVRDQVYRKVIITALRRSNWNQVKAAQRLGISRQSLIRWIRKLQISY